MGARRLGTYGQWVMATTLAVGLALPSVVEAAAYDISLRGVGRPLSNTATDPAVRRYRSLGTELAAVMAPRPWAPAETLGLNGFEFAFVSTTVPINYSQDYWLGQPGTPVIEGVASGESGVPQIVWLPTVHVRKGLPMSTEVGFTGTYMARSELFMLGAEFKIALHESFFRWVPALATRFSASRLFGSNDIDIVAGELDILASLPIGLMKSATLTPYLGYGLLFVHLNSQIIDQTPYSVTNVDDQRGGTTGSLYNFPTINWFENNHGRLVFGARLGVAFFELGVEFDYVMMSDPQPADIFSISTKLGFDV